MLDDDFGDFMDSDDDAFFLEASVQEYNKESQSLFNNDILKSQKNDTSQFSESCNNLLIADNIGADNISHSNKFNNEIKLNSSASNDNAFDATNTLAMSSSSKKDANIDKNSTKLESPYFSTYSNNSSDIPGVLHVNNRLTPGFTPVAKKRKFPGPAGLLECFEDSNSSMSEYNSPKKILDALSPDFEHIPSSQFSLEHLSLPSWLKLQSDVSSNTRLHSSAKSYSIKRVLNETSKMKLPKLMVVPILCVLLKETRNKESGMTIFMDDTDEINSKIDADVLSDYKEYIVEGTAFILQKVTFLFNVLILKAENIVSMYSRDNKQKHLQSLESVLQKITESSRSTNCEKSKPFPNMSFLVASNGKTIDNHNINSTGIRNSTMINKNFASKFSLIGKSSRLSSGETSSKSYQTKNIFSLGVTNSKTVNSDIKSGVAIQSSAAINKNLNSSRNVINRTMPGMKSDSANKSTHIAVKTSTSINSEISKSCHSTNNIFLMTTADSKTVNSNNESGDGIHKAGVTNKDFTILSNVINKNTQSLESSISASKSAAPTRGDEFFESLLVEDNCLDEFDELLGSIDERSFMGDF